jgi:hypothetical protein
MKTMAITHKMLTLLAGLILAACASQRDDRQGPATQPNLLLRADLSSRRLTGREQVSLSSTRTLYADRLMRLADGTIKASGRIYVNGGDRPNEPFLGWPRHLYATSARWTSSTQHLELLGWPVLEYRRGRIVATSADTTVIISGESIKTRGPTASGLD